MANADEPTDHGEGLIYGAIWAERPTRDHLRRLRKLREDRRGENWSGLFDRGMCEGKSLARWLVAKIAGDEGADAAEFWKNALPGTSDEWRKEKTASRDFLRGFCDGAADVLDKM